MMDLFELIAGLVVMTDPDYYRRFCSLREMHAEQMKFAEARSKYYEVKNRSEEDRENWDIIMSAEHASLAFYKKPTI